MQDRYILLTAAKNEQAYIAETIRSVVRQKVQPLAWFIMDDGSTDRTASIVERFAADHPFIRLCSVGLREGRNFGAQYKALQAGYTLARTMEFDFVGVQDADIAPEQDGYYATIMEEFRRTPRLGITGGDIYEQVNGSWQCRRGNSADSVAGGVQMFRRECFEQIGGYTPLFYGGSDSLAQLDAQLRGWEVRTRADQRIFHYRPTSTAGGRWRGFFRWGLEDASFGNHPLFELFKCCRRFLNPPVVFGSAVRFSGYLWWNLSGRRPVIEPEKVAFLRRQQLGKLRRHLWPFGAKAAGEIGQPTIG